MKKISTVTIGIPAYDEGGNLGRLLAKLLSQKTYNLEELKY